MPTGTRSQSFTRYSGPRTSLARGAAYNLRFLGLTRTLILPTAPSRLGTDEDWSTRHQVAVFRSTLLRTNADILLIHICVNSSGLVFHSRGNKLNILPVQVWCIRRTPSLKLFRHTVSSRQECHDAVVTRLTTEYAGPCLKLLQYSILQHDLQSPLPLPIGPEALDLRHGANHCQRQQEHGEGGIGRVNWLLTHRARRLGMMRWPIPRTCTL